MTKETELQQTHIQQQHILTHTQQKPKTEKKTARQAVPSSQERVPTDFPPFTLGDLKRAIPPHCFERSLLRSFSYLVADSLVVAFFFYLAGNWFDHPALPAPVSWALWVAYWILQGLFLTALWVVAHECGHQSFSDYEWVNDTVGCFFHTLVLVPYWSWKFSHAKHHRQTGKLDGDDVFVPLLAKNKTPPDPLISSFNRMVITLSMGWFLYLLNNVTGRKYSRHTDHFNPYSPIFTKKQRPWIMASNCALLIFVSFLSYLTYTFSFGWLVKIYLVPYLHVNLWLVLITLLHHTDQKIPHYLGDEWNWMRGALATVDRDYGILNTVFHHIGDTHVTHHLFPQIPHYHSEEATRAIAPILGKYYCRDTTPIWKCLWMANRNCVAVYQEGDALWF